MTIYRRVSRTSVTRNSTQLSPRSCHPSWTRHWSSRHLGATPRRCIISLLVRSMPWGGTCHTPEPVPLGRSAWILITLPLPPIKSCNSALCSPGSWKWQSNTGNPLSSTAGRHTNSSCQFFWKCYPGTGGYTFTASPGAGKSPRNGSASSQIQSWGSPPLSLTATQYGLWRFEN